MITVEATGALTLVEDLGRPGFAHLGVPRSGAVDQGALRLANRLVGNPQDAAGLEVLLGGLVLRWDGGTPVWMAVAGAATTITVNQSDQASHRAVVLQPGDRLTLQPPARGLRSYVAVRGGLDLPPMLGSRSTDVLSGLGPDPVRAGDRLVVGPAAGALPDIDFVVPPAVHGRVVLAVRLGPRADWFTESAQRLLVSATWTLTADSNRVGARLAGPTLERTVVRELPSEGVVRGAIQVPTAGQPLIFLADHPVTGGYPVIAVVEPADVDRLGQLRPGEGVRLRSIT